jgi:hypothetical protein
MSKIDLNGSWKIIWDTEGKGIANRWFVEVPGKAKNIEVPHLWRENEAPIAFYYKKITLVGKDRRCLLHFEHIAVYAVVWINGKLVGDHFGTSTSFNFDISSFVKHGVENLLCVRVANVSNSGDFELMAGGESILAEQMPLGLPWKRHPFAGFTGNVSIISGERALLSAMEIASDADYGCISVKVSFNNPRNYVAKLKIFARNPQHEVSSMQKEVKLEKENSNTTLQLKFKDISLWSVEEPNFYALEIRLESSNELISNFGFKKFDCKQGDFFLNDSVIKLHGIVYSHNKNFSVEADLENIKNLGFNAVRTGGAPFNKEALNICDRLGLLVFQEFPICDEQSSKMGLEAVKAIAPEIVCESANHPSLAAWVLGSENGRLILENGAKLLNRIDTLEGCHPAVGNINSVFIDNEQNFKHGHNKIFSTTGKVMGVTDGSVVPYSSHRLALKIFGSSPYNLFLSRYGISEDEDFTIPDPFFGDAWLQDNYKQFTDDIKKNGRVLLSIKNYAMLGSAKSNAAMQALIQQIKGFINSKAKDIFPDEKVFAKISNELVLSGLEQNIQALQSSATISGYFIEEWADFKNDFGGIVEETGESKGLEQDFKRITASTKLLMSGLERVVAQNENISFQLNMLNEKRLSEVNISVALLDKAEHPVVSQNKDFPTPKFALAPLGDMSIKAPQKAGSYKLKLTLSGGGKEIYSIEEPIEIIESPNIKNTLTKIEFLDAAENSAEIIKMINGKKPVLFTAALSSLEDNSILESVANAVKAGKILFISDIIPEDVKLFNSYKSFGCALECFYSSGACGASIRYIPKNSPLKNEFFGKSVLDKTCSAIMPCLSLQEIKGAKSFIHSVSIKNGKLQAGVDLQIAECGKGKIIFSTLNFEGLEIYALTNSLFVKIVKLATE